MARSLATEYLRWRIHFAANLCREPILPWNDAPALSSAERQLVVGSIQEFQLGEGASGRTFRGLAEIESERLRLAEVPDAVGLFIQEEQRHSAMLVRFLLREGEEVAERHWVAECFRWARKRAGFGLMVAVLSAAEILAFPYYRGLARATSSPLLRAICHQILREETAHLRFQAMNLAVSGIGRRAWVLSALLLIQRLVLEMMTGLLCWKHRQILTLVGGYRETAAIARKLLRSMHQECRGWQQRDEAETKPFRRREPAKDVEFVAGSKVVGSASIDAAGIGRALSPSRPLNLEETGRYKPGERQPRTAR